MEAWIRTGYLTQEEMAEVSGLTAEQISQDRSVDFCWQVQTIIYIYICVCVYTGYIYIHIHTCTRIVSYTHHHTL